MRTIVRVLATSAFMAVGFGGITLLTGDEPFTDVAVKAAIFGVVSGVLWELKAVQRLVNPSK